MIKRITISFTPEEREALDKIARSEMRPIKSQIKYILRQELERLGLLQPKPLKDEVTDVTTANG